MKNRPVDQKGLTLKEVREMDYLSKVWPPPPPPLSMHICVIFPKQISSPGD